MKHHPSNRWSLERLLSLAALAILALGLSNCSVHENTRQLSPSFSEGKLASMRTFYVRKHADDDYGVGEDIATQLRQMGYSATAGSAQKSPRKVDGVISYMDRWVWDMTMYMLSLDLQVRDPGSDVILANAKTVRSSLIRKPQEEMARETLTKLLKNQ